MGFKTFWLPHLEFLAEPDEGDVGGDACVFAQAFRKNCASVLIDREDLLVPNRAVASWSFSSE